MIGKIIFLAALTLSSARPADDDAPDTRSFWEPSDLCPSDKHFLLPHEWDCTKFYYCEYGLKYIQPASCAPGTEFAFSLQVCIALGTNACSLPGYPPTDPTTVAPTTQAPTTQAPTTQAPTTQAPTTQAPTTQAPTTQPPTTPAPTTRPPTTQAPTTQAPTTQAPTTQPPTTRPPTTQAPTTRPPTTQAPTTRPPTTSAPSQSNGCPADYSIHHLLPHEDCDKFYYCNFGQKVERQCAPGTYFNYAIQVCDHPWNVQCAVPPTTQAPTTRPPTTQAPTTRPPTTQAPTTRPPTTQAPTTQAPTQPPTQPPSTWLPNGCPADFSIHHLLPHADCDKFYYCNFGQKVERQCAPGTYFNYALQVCDHPWNVECAVPPTTQPPTTQPPTTQPPTTQPPTTQAPTQPPTQPPSTWLPNGCPADFSIHHLLPHVDCDKFYYCNFGEKVERQCAPGTYFNYAIQVCDHPWNVQCAVPPTTQPPTTQPPTTQAPTTQAPTTQPPSTWLPNGCPADFSIHHLLPHVDCDKFYYCNFGEKVERQCAPGTYFNYAIQVCDHPWNVQCAVPPTTQAPTTQAPTTQPPSTWLPNGCPADFSIHHLLPHVDCDKFYYCNFGEKVERQCAPGTYFNYAIQVCDHPWNVECAVPPTTQPPTTQPPTTQPPTTQPPTTQPPTTEPPTTQPPSAWLPNGCPADFSIHHLLPHVDCDKFYYCNFGEKVERQCALGTYFNYALQVCDHPWNVECAVPPTTQPPTTQPPTTQPPTTQPPTTEPPTTEPPTTQPPSAWLPNGCPANFSIHHLLPHADCDKFYYCNFGEKVERQCAPGTYFNYALQVCDHPWNVECAVPPTTQPPTTQPPTTEPPTTQPPSTWLPNGCPANFSIHHLLPHADCDKFYYCNFGEKVERQCAPGTYFNYALQVCDHPWNVECAVPPTTQPPTTQPPTTQPPTTEPPTTQPPSTWLPNGCPANFSIHHLLPHADCDKFYYCNFGEKVERQCAPGTYFNYALQVCDHSWNVECAGGGENGGSGENGGNGETDKCKNSCNVLPWAHETDCDKFWRCDGETSVLTTCSEGLHFNSNTYTCDFICNAGCVQEEARATMGADGVKIFLPWDKVDNEMERLIELSMHQEKHHLSLDEINNETNE